MICRDQAQLNAAHCERMGIRVIPDQEDRPITVCVLFSNGKKPLKETFHRQTFADMFPENSMRPD
jgi:hypothetical protein